MPTEYKANTSFVFLHPTTCDCTTKPSNLLGHNANWPAKPDSVMLGTSGKALERLALVTASGLTLPFLIKGSSAAIVPVIS